MDEDEINSFDDIIEVDVRYEEFSSDEEIDFQFDIDDQDYSEILKSLYVKDSDFEDDDNGEKTECPFKDQGCKLSFLRKYNLIKHLKTHEPKEGTVEVGSICHICGKIIKTSISHHLKHHDEIKRFACDVCGRSFKQKIALKKHLMIHMGIKPYTCPYCSRCFRQKPTMESHLRSKHIGIKEHACELCGKEFGDKNSLQKHSLVHTTSQPHQCKTCFMTFRHKTSLSRHTKVHQRLTQCGFCDRTFRYESFLKKHVLTAHKGLENLREGMKERTIIPRKNVLRVVKQEVKVEEPCIIQVVKVEEPRIIQVDANSQFFSQTITIRSVE